MRPNFVTTDMTMPAGKYYVGDLCYVMHDYWDEIMDHVIVGQGCVDGVFTLKDGTRFAHVSTHYGDGSFLDQEGRMYAVDAGSIGCVLLSVAEKDKTYDFEELGNVIEFTEPFVVGGDQDGNIFFGDVAISTGFYTDEDDIVDYSYESETAEY